jgi:hypothetical protein
MRELRSELKRLIDLYEKQYVDGDGRIELSNVLTEIGMLLPKVMNWAILRNSLDDRVGKGLDASFLKTALEDLKIICSRTLSTFEKIGENLQVGKDGEALSDLFYVTELMDEIVYVLQFFMVAYSMDSAILSQSDLGMEELFSKVSAALKGVEEAFLSEDLITVGDILEYEIKPLFESMIDLLHRLGVFIG